MPLNMRLTILEKIIDPLEGAIIFLNRKRISSKTEAIDSLNEAIDNREEGIVIKEFMSMYKPNIRKNGGWYKIKPEVRLFFFKFRFRNGLLSDFCVLSSSELLTFYT